MKSKRKQILISSLLMLIVATMALTSTTFAWFTSSATGKVSDFEFTAEDASGIQLSVDAKSWKSTIAKEDIETAVAATGDDKKAQANSLFTAESSKFAPLSTAGSFTNGAMDLYKISNLTDTSLKSEKVGDSDKSYYMFNIYVNNVSAETKEIKLSKLNVNDSTTESENKGTSMSARIAIIEQGSVASTADGAYNTITAATATSGTAFIYEPNATVHTDYAKTYRGAVADTVAEYKGLQKAYDTVPVADYVAVNGTADGTTALVKDVKTSTVDDTVLATVASGNIVKFTVYVWIEGQDIDCNNDAASGKVTVNFEFEAKNQPKVTYVSNAGQTTEEPIEDIVLADLPAPQVCKSDVETTLGTCTREGYVFVGWSENKDTDPTATEGIYTKLKVTSDKTLYAIWATSVTVKYNANGKTLTGGTTCPADVTVAKGREYTVVTPDPTLTCEGFTFVGWNTDETASVGMSTITPTDASTTLYAIWTPEE